MGDPRRAELYANLHAGNAGDLELYARVCRGARSVLELGSGAGRIAGFLAAQGFEMTGLELDDDLLALARERSEPASSGTRLTWVRADMRDFDLGRQFERILLPYNGLYCLGGSDGALACFRQVKKHLAPGGEFWLDVYAIDAFHDEAPEDAAVEGDADGAWQEEGEPVAEVVLDQEVLDVHEATRWSRESQRLDVEYRFVRGGHEVARQQLTHHYLLGTEIVLLLEEAGLEVGTASGGFAGEPLEEDAEFLVLGARHAC
jgi:SAM-dependent methyltransferase